MIAAMYDPHRHNRRSIRLKGYDYTRPGAYFVTICVQNHVCLFGEVIKRNVVLNDAGRLVKAVWDEIPDHYAGVAVDEFVVMPNHIHGIITLVGAGPRPRACPESGTNTQPDLGPRVRPKHRIHSQPGKLCRIEQPYDMVRSLDTGQPRDMGQPQGVAPTTPLSLSDVVHRFKSLTTRRYADHVLNDGWTPFRGRLWQRNYYECIIRDGDALNRIRQYIADNPARWR